MSEPRRLRNPHIRACLNCQKRKTRCMTSPQDPSSCIQCVKNETQCVFEARPNRTSLTRSNLDTAERRCMQLEALLRSLHPDIDINVEIKKLGSSYPNKEQFSGDGGLDDTGASIDEDYEWNEGVVPDRTEKSGFENDGMASSPAPTSGYLGVSSMSRMLQTISSLLPPTTEQESQSGRPTPGSIRVKSTHTPSPLLNSELASIADAGRLIDAYFFFYNSNYPILHERTFRERWEKRSRIRQTSSWVPICYTVLAIGQWILGGEGTECPFYPKARSWLTAQALECGTVGAVQAFLLMGNYVQKRNKPNTGYNMMGIAHRMAIGLGMHREIPSIGQDSLAFEQRRQVFWTLFCFDVGVSITTGRPATIIDSFIDTRMPRNIDDSHLDLNALIPLEVEYPTTYSALIAHAHLAMVSNEIYTQFLSARIVEPEAKHEMATTLENKLFSWENSLPAYFRADGMPQWFVGPRDMLYWRAKNIRILLWRGSQRFHSEGNEKLTAGLKCCAAAVETIQDITKFCETYPNLLNTMISWYATYFLFQAMLVLEVHRLEKRRTPYVTNVDVLAGEAGWDEIMERGRECLRTLNTPKSAAGRCLDTLDRIHKHRASSTPDGASVSLGEEAQRTYEPFGTFDDIQGGFPDVDLDSPEFQWAMSADPSLHMLLEGPQMDDLFRGVEGFPGTLDQDSFDYISGDLYRI